MTIPLLFPALDIAATLDTENAVSPAPSPKAEGNDEAAVAPSPALAESESTKMEKEMYTDELDQLENLGFNDRSFNLSLLRFKKGNVQVVANFLS